MARPPQSPPHSDLDGVNEDEVSNVEAANASGQDGKDLARARDQAAGKPEYSDEESRDDRSR